MPLRLTAKVEGEGVAGQLFQVEAPDVTVGFDVDKKHHVTAIWAECAVPNYRDYAPTMVPGDGTRQRPHQISMPLPPQIEDLRATLQYIESLGSFWLGIRRVAWSEAETRWVPDTDTERRALSVLSIAQTLQYPNRPVPFRHEVLARLMANREGMEYLVIPMSFYREGIGDYRSHRYVSAFYNFYFFLEDLYGKGKTKNQAVLESFQASAQLRDAVKRSHEDLEQPVMEGNRTSLREIASALRCHYSADGPIDFLVMVRGELHHFSQRSSRPKGHPLNQLQWRPVAFFAMSVCIRLIERLASGTPPDSFTP